LGRRYYAQGEWDAAREEIQKARKLNPFDRGLAEISGRIEFELKNFDGSLDAFIDAFLLSTDQKGESTEPVRRMINTLKRIHNIDAKDLNVRIKDRVEQLQLATERLEFRTENLFKLESRKETPFGPQILGALTADTIFGEMNFIDRTHRSSDAVAVEPSACYTFSFSALDQLMDEDKELAVGLHWAFWRSLTVKVRDA